MTISTNKDVLAGEDLTVQGAKKLHTDDIAGTAKLDTDQFAWRNTAIVTIPRK
jgi:hypothetical protein